MGGRLPVWSVLAGLALPVLAGIAWLAFSGAPTAWMISNGAALVLALLLAMWLPLPRRTTGILLLAVALVALLFAVALAGKPVDGVRRWLSLGPVSIHAGYLLLPLLAALVSRLESVRAVALLLLAMLTSLLQPDRAITMALAAALAALAMTRRDRTAYAGLALGIAGGAAFLGTADLLAPVRWVEGVQQEAWRILPAAGAILALATLAPLLVLRRHGRASLPLTAFMTAAGLMAFAGPYPSILLGYGAAPILGFGLALAALRQEDARA